MGEVGQAYYRKGTPWSNIVLMVHKCLTLPAVTLNELTYKLVFERVAQNVSSGDCKIQSIIYIYQPTVFSIILSIQPHWWGHLNNFVIVFDFL